MSLLVNSKNRIQGPLSGDAIRALKARAKDEDKLADAAYVEMQQATEAQATLAARNLSEKMKAHRYAATQFREMAKQLEDEQ